MVIEEISKRLALPIPFLEKLARTASHRYCKYSIPKRTGGERTIYHPAKELKLIQRWLLQNVLINLPIHPAATAYRPEINIARNAEKHVSNNYLLRVDFEDFFPSLRDSDVVGVLEANSQILVKGGLTAEDLNFITKIVCRSASLTIGAPTSPQLSNAIMFPLDQTWSDQAKELEVTYTRYADDLYFSTNRPNVLNEILTTIRRELNANKAPKLTINEKKTALSSRKYRRLVAGLVLTSDRKISIGRDKKRRLSAFVNKLKRRQLQAQDVQKLRGWIAYVRSVEPMFVKALQRNMKSILLRAIFGEKAADVKDASLVSPPVEADATWKL
jgi:hypothetical protein